MPEPRILLSNDDGIAAPGLKVLERIAANLSDDIWTVAPEQEQSGASHSLTLHVPVRLRKLSARRYAVSGTPTDCVMLGLKEIIPSSSARHRRDGDPAQQDKDPRMRQAHSGMTVDLILSGVNKGSNVGDDITYSGTVAAAMEGAVLGVPSIALSQLYTDKVHWQTAEQHAPALIQKLLAAGWPKNSLMNLNFPDCPPDKVKGVRVCPQGKREVSVALLQRIDPKGRPYFWIGGPRENASERADVDVALLEAGYITVTPLCLDMTDYKTLNEICGSL